jgi:para-aminobenzoate synthetase component 1
MPRADKIRYVHPNGPVVEEIAWVDPEAAFMPYADMQGALWLDSADAAHHAARYSFIALAPYKTIAIADWQAASGFAALDTELRRFEGLWAGLDPQIDAIVPPFRGGAAGLFGYDLAYGLEELPPNEAPFAVDELHVPAMVQGLYASVLGFDHQAKRCFIIATGLPATTPAARSDAANRDISAWKARLKGVPSSSLPAPPAAPILTAPLSSNFSRAAYCDAVAATVGDILNGDIFQANLAQCFTARLDPDDGGFDYYRRLRRESPAPFAAYACFDGFQLASASPERFLQCAAGVMETRPIKGTAPRGLTPQEDAAIAANLEASEKNRAENVMIVDLLRNDLAKSCADGSVHVPQLCALESFSNVHHLVSTVRGQLAPGKSPLDALRVAFPGGSITGAPKIRAMQIIATREDRRRGPAYGSIGFIGFDGRMDTNIIIRTAVVTGTQIFFHAGGGIVADSDPQAEYSETLNKARGLISALGVTADALADAPHNDEVA